MKNNGRKWGQQNNTSKHFYFIGLKILKLSQGTKDKKILVQEEDYTCVWSVWTKSDSVFCISRRTGTYGSYITLVHKSVFCNYIFIFNLYLLIQGKGGKKRRTRGGGL